MLRESWEIDRTPSDNEQLIDWLAKAKRRPAKYTGSSELRDDVAALLTMVTESGHEGATYELTGPQSLTLGEAAAELTSFTGRTVTYRLSDQHTVARSRTSDEGRFSVRVRPGRYGLSARPAAGGSLPRCPRVTATVRRGSYARITIDCDSGIR